MDCKINDIKSIVIDYLEKNGFDGLLNENVSCGCEISALMPCDDCWIGECVPGYKTPCPGPGKCYYGQCDFHISIEKG
jgi:hypothetical protein